MRGSPLGKAALVMALGVPWPDRLGLLAPVGQHATVRQGDAHAERATADATMRYCCSYQHTPCESSHRSPLLVQVGPRFQSPSRPLSATGISLQDVRLSKVR